MNHSDGVTWWSNSTYTRIDIRRCPTLQISSVKPLVAGDSQRAQRVSSIMLQPQLATASSVFAFTITLRQSDRS